MSRYKISNFEEYFKEYKKSIKDPKKFWDKIASENFTWYQEWDKVVDFNMAEAEIKWFVDAKVNITKNCIDRHLAKKGDKTAIPGRGSRRSPAGCAGRRRSRPARRCRPRRR